MSSPQPPHKVETLLSSLSGVSGVQGPCEVLCDVDAQELGALNNLDRGAVEKSYVVINLCARKMVNPIEPISMFRCARIIGIIRNHEHY